MNFNSNEKVFSSKKEKTASVTKLGAYKATITEAIDIPDYNAIDFLGTTSEDKTFSFRIFYKHSDGANNLIGRSKIINLIDFIGVNDINPINGHYKELEDIEIGILLNPYTTNKGFTNLGHICWFDINTKQTIWELEKDTEAVYVDYKLEQLKEI